MSFAGFGFAMISVPLLTLFFPVKEAVILQFPYCMGLFMYQAWIYRRQFRWRPIQPLFLGTVTGLVLGTFFLYYMPETVLKRMLALFIAIIVIYNFISARKQFTLKYFESPWFGRLCGFISGSFFGAYNLGGPPIVMFCRTLTKNPLKAKSYMATFFSVMYLPVVVLYVATGMFSIDSLKTSALYFPAVVIGSAAGFWVFHRASSSLYNRVIDMVLLLISVTLWLNG